jgi:hypothetical protein
MRTTIFLLLACCGVTLEGANSSARDLTAAEKGLLISVRHFTNYDLTLPSDLGKSEKYAYITDRPDSWGIEYEYKSPEDGSSSPLFISCEFELQPTTKRAASSFRDGITGFELGIKKGGITIEKRPKLFRWGDESFCAYMKKGDNIVGNIISIRKKNKIYTVIFTGIYFSQTSDLNKFLIPKLEEVDVYDPAHAVPTQSNTFSNYTVGLSVTKPSDWQFVTAEQHMENLGRTHLNNKEMQEAMKKYATAPLVVIMKHPEPYDDLNPTFKINIKPLGDMSADDPKAILELVTAQMPKMFKNFKVVTPASDTTVAGLKAAYTRIHYSLQISDGREFPTCSELWIVPRGHFFFIIGSGTKQDEKTGKRAEIQKILSSLKIDSR